MDYYQISGFRLSILRYRFRTGYLEKLISGIGHPAQPYKNNQIQNPTSLPVGKTNTFSERIKLLNLCCSNKQTITYIV